MIGHSTSSKLKVIMTVGQLIREVNLGGYSQYECVLCGSSKIIDVTTKPKHLHHWGRCKVAQVIERKRARW